MLAFDAFPGLFATQLTPVPSQGHVGPCVIFCSCATHALSCTRPTHFSDCACVTVTHGMLTFGVLKRQCWDIKGLMETQNQGCFEFVSSFFLVQHADKPTVICIPIASKGRRTQPRIGRRGSSSSDGGLPVYKFCGCPRAHPGRSFFVWSFKHAFPTTHPHSNCLSFVPMLVQAAGMALPLGPTRDWKREFISHL